MKIRQQIIIYFKEISKDRLFLVPLAGFWILCAALIVYLLVQIHPTELQVVVHYTGFGPTNFYRDKWYYLISFVFFVIILAVAHGAAAYKLLNQKGRDLALAFVWFSIILVVITSAIFYQILKIASLS